MCKRHIYFLETCTMSLKYSFDWFRLQIHFTIFIFIKCLVKNILCFRTFPGNFKFSIKSAWKRSVCTIPGTFNISIKKCLAKCVIYFCTSPGEDPQALYISSAVSSPVPLHLWKKVPGEKSAWDAASQHPAYYAGLATATNNSTQNAHNYFQLKFVWSWSLPGGAWVGTLSGVLSLSRRVCSVQLDLALAPGFMLGGLVGEQIHKKYVRGSKG